MCRCLKHEQEYPQSGYCVYCGLPGTANVWHIPYVWYPCDQMPSGPTYITTTTDGKPEIT